MHSRRRALSAVARALLTCPSRSAVTPASQHARLEHTCNLHLWESGLESHNTAWMAWHSRGLSSITRSVNFQPCSLVAHSLALSRRSLASQSAQGSPEQDHDPIRTRIIHMMVIGTFLVAGSNVLPYIGVTSVENSARLLCSKDTMMQEAGADRLRYLAAFSENRRKEMVAGPVLEQLVSRVDVCTEPAVLNSTLQALAELVKEEEGRAALASNERFLTSLVQIASSQDSDLQPLVVPTAQQLLKDTLRPPLL